MTAPTPGAEHDDKIAEALRSQSGVFTMPAELRAQLAARGLCITPIAPTTGAGFADGMRKAAEILLTLDIEFVAAEKKAGRPTHDEAGRPASISDARSAIDTAYARILASIPSAPSPTPTREREVEAVDLPMFWGGRARALRILDGQRSKSDNTTLETAKVYDECASELSAALDAIRSRPEADK